MNLGSELLSPPLTPAQSEDTLQARIRRESAEALLKAQSMPEAAVLINLCWWVFFYYQMRLTSIVVWGLMVHATQLARYLTKRRDARLTPAQRDPEKIAARYCVDIAISGVLVGLAPWMFFPADNMPLLALMMMVILSITSATASGFAPSRRAILSFQVPVYVGLVSALFWQREWMYVGLGLATLLYPYVTIRFALQQNKLLHESMRARFENEALAEKYAEQVRRVEHASLEKTRFFASASHDLRQPLHSLGLFGSAVQARLKGTPDEALARNLMHCVDALETSFSAMLDVSKLDAGVVEVHAQPVALSQVFQKLESVFGKQAEAQALHLRFSTGGKWVYADAALLERLLGNLVHNALKFTTKGGVVVLARTRGASVSIEVWDSGAGMDVQELPLIFDEFYQVGNQERDRSRGLGMGLAIVQRLAALMGLNLRVHSRTGRGTVFKLGVPMAAAQKLPAPIASQTLSSGVFRALSHMHILVVDDEETVRASTSDALRLYGFQVEVANGLAQAREAALRLGDKLDGLITDFRLADAIDGIDLANNLRALLGRQLPTLLVTGDTAPERVRKAQLSGLRVLYKPVKIHTLVEELRLQITQAK
jgi:signal transduction histidine kinase/ActR/RegA family two-component response regulator